MAASLVHPSEPRVKVTSHNCKSWACPRCSRVLGRRLGARLRDRLSSERVVLITLTVDRGHFPTPLDAYTVIKQTKAIPRGIERFGDAWGFDARGQWFAKMELQESGWPHWHILCIVPPEVHIAFKGSFDEFWRWGFSNVQQRGCNIGYATKYAVKPAACFDALEASGLPGRGVRWTTAARGFWGLGRKVDDQQNAGSAGDVNEESGGR